MAIIVLDPGHGGSTKIGGSSPNNATGPTGLLEKAVTLDVGQRAKDVLVGMGQTVRMTRTDDANLGLSQRSAVARAAKADVFISIHFNGFNGTAQGTETLLDMTHSSRSRNLAMAVQKRMVGATGLKDRGVKSQPLGVLKPSGHAPNTACCLVEISFLDVATEETRLRTDGYRTRLAEALANGIADFLAAAARESTAAPAPARRLEDGFALLANEAKAEQRRPGSASGPDRQGG